MKKRNFIANIIIGSITIITIFILAILLFQSSPMSETDKALSQEGYKTKNEEDPFYKKILTNNTLDEYYNNVNQNKDSKYEEYYLAKESLNLIGLKMEYTNGVSKTLNISSNLKSATIDFNYEQSSNNSYLLMTGSSKDNYNCQVITKKNVRDDTFKRICESIPEEITTFIPRTRRFQEIYCDTCETSAKDN